MPPKIEPVKCAEGYFVGEIPYNEYLEKTLASQREDMDTLKVKLGYDPTKIDQEDWELTVLAEKWD